MTIFKHKADHLAKGYVCPVCGEDAVEGDEVVVDGTEATQHVSCTACDAEWVDLYQLTQVLEVVES